MTRRLPLALAAAVAAIALALAGPAMAQAGSSTQPDIPTQLPARPTTGMYDTVPANTFVPCAFSPQGWKWMTTDQLYWLVVGWDCATITRPLSRSNRSLGTVTLPVVRHPALAGPDDKIGTLFMNPGGPGQSGLDLSEMWFTLPEAVKQRYDFVTWDPRGINFATPALQGQGCNIPKLTRPATGPINWQGILQQRVQQIRKANQLCFAANANLVNHAGTIENAYDLEAMRKWVGDSTLTYWGISYGTLLGSTYAQLFPSKVGKMIFDGNMNPQTTLKGINAGSIAPDDSIGFFLQANPDVAQQYSQVIQRLNQKPMTLKRSLAPGQQPVMYTRWDLLDVLNDSVDFYYEPGSDWQNARLAITTAWQAAFATGTQKQQARQALLTNSSLSSPSTGTVGSLWSAVVCQDMSDRISASSQQKLLAWDVLQGPLYGGTLGMDYLTTCNGYGQATPHPVPIPTAYGPNITGLILNTTHDGETPYQWAVNMARTYPSMTMVTLVGGIHGSFGIGNSPCVNAAVVNLLVDGGLGGVDGTTMDQACPYSPPPAKAP